MARKDNFRQLDPAAVVAAVTTMLQANERFYSGFRVRCVAYLDEQSWRNALCVVQAIPEGTLPEKARSLRYERLRLLEEWPDREGVLTLIQAAITGEVSIDGERVVIVTDGAYHFTNNLQSNNEHSIYPGREFITQVQPRGFQDEPHFSYDLPLYPNLDAATNAWTGLDTRNRNGTTRTGFVILFLPECRARIADESYAGGKLILQVPTEVTGLRVKGAWRANDEFQHFDCEVAEGRAEAVVPTEAEELDLYLVGPDETLYDWHSETSTGVAGHKRILADHLSARANEATVKQARLEGEGETIEFKVYVEPGHKKEWELVDTVIAFANWKGGHLLIGINDYCEVEGIEQQIINKAQPNLEDDMNREIRRLRKLFTDKITPSVTPEFAHVWEAGHSVLLITVPKGPNPPYFRSEDGMMFIRRGASTRRPDPVRELPLLMGQRGRQGIFGDPLAGLKDDLWR